MKKKLLGQRKAVVDILLIGQGEVTMDILLLGQ